jgi:hypothetical protein
MANIFLRQSAEFFERFFRFGGTIKMIVKLLGDDELMNWWVGELKSHSTFRLIHGVFNPTVDVLESLKACCAKQSIEFDRFAWDGPEEAPDFDLKDPKTAVVLEANLGDLQETFEFVWGWTKEGQHTNWRWDGMDSCSDKLRLLSGGKDFKPWTLCWRRIKLDANVGKKPEDVRDPKTSPGLALLYVAAEHPECVMATDCKKCFGWYIPGLECTAPGYEPWQHVPCVRFNRDSRKVGLGAFWYDGAYDGLAVPVYRE